MILLSFAYARTCMHKNIRMCTCDFDLQQSLQINCSIDIIHEYNDIVSIVSLLDYLSKISMKTEIQIG